MKFLLANSIASDGTPGFAVSHLGLFCLPTSHEKDARLTWVKASSTKKSLPKNSKGLFDYLNLSQALSCYIYIFWSFGTVG